MEEGNRQIKAAFKSKLTDAQILLLSERPFDFWKKVKAKEYVLQPVLDFWDSLTIEKQHEHKNRVEEELGLSKDSIVSMEPMWENQKRRTKVDMTKCERCKVAINPNDVFLIEGNHVLCRECAIELRVSGTKQKEKQE